MKRCLYCLEPIEAGEPIEPTNGGARWLHSDCMIRMVAGSVGHQRGACSCFGGTDGDPPGMTLREAAAAAANMFRARPQ